MESMEAVDRCAEMSGKLRRAYHSDLAAFAGMGRQVSGALAGMAQDNATRMGAYAQIAQVGRDDNLNERVYRTVDLPAVDLMAEQGALAGYGQVNVARQGTMEAVRDANVVAAAVGAPLARQPGATRYVNPNTRGRRVLRWLFGRA